MSVPVPADAGKPCGAPPPPVSLRRQALDFSALGALFWLTLRQQARGRRLIVLALLFALPTGLAVLIRSLSEGISGDVLQAQLILNLIPQALAPLAALLYATGVIQDEIEEQTLTYLLIRPLPRAALYVTKLLAAMLTSSLLAAAGTFVVYIAIYWGTSDLWGDVLPYRAAKVAVLFAVAQVGYCAIFSFISLLTRRSLIAGIAYIVVIEGALANWPFIVRQLTVMYYFRVLTLHWLSPPSASVESWAIDPADAFSTATCLAIVLGTSVALTIAGGLTFAAREFGVKTPEGAN
jgi:ABC-2 type transport system permease protein